MFGLGARTNERECMRVLALRPPRMLVTIALRHNYNGLSHNGRPWKCRNYPWHGSILQDKNEASFLSDSIILENCLFSTLDLMS